MLASRHDPSSSARGRRGRRSRRPRAGRVRRRQGRRHADARATRNAKLLRDHDVVSMHVPAVRGREPRTACAPAASTPRVMTYHCDLQLPPARSTGSSTASMAASNTSPRRARDRIVAYTDDYADSVPLLRRFRREGRDRAAARRDAAPRAAVRVGRVPRTTLAVRRPTVTRRPSIGMAARFATEKGIDVLPRCAAAASSSGFRTFSVLFAGPHEGIPARRRTVPGSRPRFAGSATLAFPRGARPRRRDAGVPRCARLPGRRQRQLDRVVRSRAGGGDALRHPGRRERASGSARGRPHDGHGRDRPAAAIRPALADGGQERLEHPERYRRTRSEIEAMYDARANRDAIRGAVRLGRRAAARGARNGSEAAHELPPAPGGRPCAAGGDRASRRRSRSCPSRRTTRAASRGPASRRSGAPLIRSVVAVADGPAAGSKLVGERRSLAWISGRVESEVQIDPRAPACHRRGVRGRGASIGFFASSQPASWVRPGTSSRSSRSLRLPPRSGRMPS